MTRSSTPAAGDPTGCIGIVSAGRVGATLGAALRAAGRDLTAVSAPGPRSEARAAALLPGVALHAPSEVARRSDLLLLAVPDDRLAGLVASLAAHGAFRVGQVVAHTSGRHGLDILAPAAQSGARCLAVHPAMTFTGTADDLPRLAGAAYGVTTLGRNWPLAEELVSALGGVAVAVPEELRPLWHAGLAHGANHLVTLVASALEVTARTGVSDPAAVLRPLLSAALDNALRMGDAALTGPVARGDGDTVARHLDAMAESAPAELELYAAMARATASRRPGGPSASVAAALDPAAQPLRRATR